MLCESALSCKAVECNGVALCSWLLTLCADFDQHVKEEIATAADADTGNQPSTSYNPALLLDRRSKSSCHVCTVCNKRLRSALTLVRHLRIHADERPFPCHICEAGFTQLGNLKRHISVIHAGERRYSCSDCNKSFTSAYNLKVHMLTHTDDKPFRCTVCKKGFIQSGNLKLHIMTHTGEKPFPCGSCQRKFKTASDLNAHMRTHAGSRPFTCYMCEEKFSYLSGLKKHMTLHQ